MSMPMTVAIDRHRERAAGAVDRAGEHVVADVVGAEPVLGRRPVAGDAGERPVRVLERQEVGEDGAEEQQHQPHDGQPRTSTPSLRLR